MSALQDHDRCIRVAKRRCLTELAELRDKCEDWHDRLFELTFHLHVADYETRLQLAGVIDEIMRESATHRRRVAEAKGDG